jgi:hypothetical protein
MHEHWSSDIPALGCMTPCMPEKLAFPGWGDWKGQGSQGMGNCQRGDLLACHSLIKLAFPEYLNLPARSFGSNQLSTGFALNPADLLYLAYEPHGR